jgi:ribosomal protein S18 acetylase RimI-like enzyme
MAAEPFLIRRLAANDLRAYKALRDRMLDGHPEAFTSDVDTDRHRRAEDYLPRLGLDRAEGGHLTLGAWQGAALVGAIGLERDARPKVRHIGHVVGMMVRDDAQRRGIGQALLEALIGAARGPTGLELMTLTVTEANDSAVRLYERAGFERFGLLPHALKIGTAYHAKIHMVKLL